MAFELDIDPTGALITGLQELGVAVPKPLSDHAKRAAQLDNALYAQPASPAEVTMAVEAGASPEDVIALIERVSAVQAREEYRQRLATTVRQQLNGAGQRMVRELADDVRKVLKGHVTWNAEIITDEWLAYGAAWNAADPATLLRSEGDSVNSYRRAYAAARQLARAEQLLGPGTGGQESDVTVARFPDARARWNFHQKLGNLPPGEQGDPLARYVCVLESGGQLHYWKSRADQERHANALAEDSGNYVAGQGGPVRRSGAAAPAVFGWADEKVPA